MHHEPCLYVYVNAPFLSLPPLSLSFPLPEGAAECMHPCQTITKHR